MANICSNSTAFFGPKEDLERLLAALKSAKSVNLGKMFEKATGEKAHDVLYGTQTIGGIEDCRVSEKNGHEYFQLDYDSRWSPVNEEIDEMLRKHFPTIEEVTIAEEPGCDIYMNTDDEGIFFPERYDLDASVKNRYTNDDEHYFETEEDVLKALNEFQRKNGLREFSSIQEAEEWYGDEDNNPDPNSDFFLHVHEYYSY